jgi:hypothetical protein
MNNVEKPYMYLHRFVERIPKSEMEVLRSVSHPLGAQILNLLDQYQPDAILASVDQPDSTHQGVRRDYEKLLDIEFFELRLLAGEENEEDHKPAEDEDIEMEEDHEENSSQAANNDADDEDEHKNSNGENSEVVDDQKDDLSIHADDANEDEVFDLIKDKADLAESAAEVVEQPSKSKLKKPASVFDRYDYVQDYGYQPTESWEDDDPQVKELEKSKTLLDEDKDKALEQRPSLKSTLKAKMEKIEKGEDEDIELERPPSPSSSFLYRPDNASDVSNKHFTIMTCYSVSCSFLLFTANDLLQS